MRAYYRTSGTSIAFNVDHSQPLLSPTSVTARPSTLKRHGNRTSRLHSTYISSDVKELFETDDDRAITFLVLLAHRWLPTFI